MATLRVDLTSDLISVREYRHTSYSPDCDYVDGRIEERNLGEYDHALLQTLLGQLFMNNRAAWGVIALTDVRVQVSATRFRIPDITVLRVGVPKEPVLTRPPLMAIEILSPEDRLNAVTERAQEYLEFGIEYIWIVDPKKRLVHRLTPAGLERVPSGEIAVDGTPIRVVLSELFAELDRV